MNDDSRHINSVARWGIAAAIAAIISAAVAILAFGRDLGDWTPWAGPSPTATTSWAPGPGPQPDGPTPQQEQPTSSTRTKAAYLTAADAVCRKWYEANAKEQQSDHSDSAKLRNVNGIFHNMIGEWSEVERPPGADADIERILDLFRDANAIMDQMAVAFDSRDSTRYHSLNGDSVTADNKANAAARAFGHRVCGNY